MNNENNTTGTKVEKCPKCGMEYDQKNWKFLCGSDRGVGLMGRQSNACKRIAELEEELKYRESAYDKLFIAHMSDNGLVEDEKR